MITTVPPYPFHGYEDEDADYFDLQLRIIQWESWQSVVLAEWLKREFSHIRYVADLGCGTGTYLVPFKLLGCEVFGVDACSKGGILLRESEFRRLDLRFPILGLQDVADVCFCLETAEHIHAEYADTLVDNVCRAAPLVVWTAATVGQGGTHHHHEAPHSYWIAKFADRGYRIHEKQGEMRALLATLAPLRAVGASSGWLADNSYIFVKDSARTEDESR